MEAKNKQINLESMSQIELADYAYDRWLDLCKFHTDKPLVIELVNSIRWLEHAKEYYPDVYEVAKDYVDKINKSENMS